MDVDFWLGGARGRARDGNACDSCRAHLRGVQLVCPLSQFRLWSARERRQRARVLNHSRARELQERAIRGLDDDSRVVVDFASGACRRRADLNLPELRRQLFHGANFPLR